MKNTLAPFFDFRISGEDDDIFPYRKPHPFIYEKTLSKLSERRPSPSSNFEGVWCHVGDCLANDVSASAECGAKAIWMCLEDDQESAASRLTNVDNTPSYSTATAEEIEQRALEVQQGRSKVSASIQSLSELPDAISTILLQSSKSSMASFP
jgi:FMN phosphatase YigB (HAD superfamily)